MTPDIKQTVDATTNFSCISPGKNVVPEGKVVPFRIVPLMPKARSPTSRFWESLHAAVALDTTPPVIRLTTATVPIETIQI